MRDEVRNGAMLSDAFAQQGVFPPIYVTSVLAGERSGSLPEVLERFITYQRLALSVRKKLLVSLMYPAVLVVLALMPDRVPGDLRRAEFRDAVPNYAGAIPAPTQILIAIGTTARSYVIAGIRSYDRGDLSGSVLVADGVGRETVDRVMLRTPLVGEVWLKYQVAQFSRVLGTLLVGGIPLMQALDTASDSLGTGC